jgi:hypothetical protein
MTFDRAEPVQVHLPIDPILEKRAHPSLDQLIAPVARPDDQRQVRWITELAQNRLAARRDIRPGWADVLRRARPG